MPTQHKFIDMHTHFFNGRYLPLDGILQSWGVPSLLAKALTRVIVPLVGRSKFNASNATEADDETLDAIIHHDDGKLFHGIVKRTARAIERHADKQLDDPGSQQELSEMIDGLKALRAMQHHSNTQNAFSNNFVEHLAKDAKLLPDIMDTSEAQAIEDTLFWALSEVDRMRDPRMEMGHDHSSGMDHDDSANDTNNEMLSKAHVKKEARVGSFGSLGQIIRFIASMFLSERNRYRLIVKDYLEGKPADGFDATHFVGLPPDMQMPYQFLYGKRTIPPSYEAKLQTTRMVALSKDTGGHVITYGAVDPFRVFDWEEYVNHAVELGISGFKI